jgi:Fe-S cluster assembly iron-binding protein IscA
VGKAQRIRADDDVAVTRDGATVLVDPVSLEMLKGAELDFVDDLMGSRSGSRTRMRSHPAAAG